MPDSILNFPTLDIFCIFWPVEHVPIGQTAKESTQTTQSYHISNMHRNVTLFRLLMPQRIAHLSNNISLSEIYTDSSYCFITIQISYLSLQIKRFFLLPMSGEQVSSSSFSFLNCGITFATHKFARTTRTLNDKNHNIYYKQPLSKRWDRD